MVVLIGIAFLAGVITAVSPCVLPVLPIVLAGGASGSRRRPHAIVAGLVVSFALFTLFATWILDQLGLPKDFLRNVAIGLLFLLAASLVVPQLGRLLERPFLRFSRMRGRTDLGGGFLLGISLGLVFVPCAGPVLTVISVKAATLDFGWRTVALTFAYSLGAGVVMLGIAKGGNRLLRAYAVKLRAALGVVMALAALAIVFNLDTKAQTALGDYTNFLQRHTEKTSYAQKRLNELTGAGGGVARAATNPALADYGPAPSFAGISHWLNTPGDRPLTLAGLRGKVVLIDFWTYSCINCLRTLPYLEAWDRTYRKDGLVIVGVHTPEFAFEHDLSNVRSNAAQLGVRYPIALDDGYGTWNAYRNEYWPAEYLIDRRGRVRHAHFGEGEYDKTESLIRTLLAERSVKLPRALNLVDRTPTGLITPESYLGYERLANYAGAPIKQDALASYRLPFVLGLNQLAYGGSWRVELQRIVAGRGAALRLHFQARKVHLVLGGRGTVTVILNGKPLRTVAVTEDRLYTLVALPRIEQGQLELRFTSGLAAYAFTFG